jgi:hypothetical protein
VRRTRVAAIAVALLVTAMMAAGGFVFFRGEDEPQLAPLPLVERLLPSCLGSIRFDSTSADGQLVQIYHPNCAHEPTPVLRIGDHWFGLLHPMNDHPQRVVRDRARWLLYGGCQILRSDDGGRSFVALRPPDWEPDKCYCVDKTQLSIDEVVVQPIAWWSPTLSQRFRNMAFGWSYANDRRLLPRTLYFFASFSRAPPNASKTYVSHDGGLTWSPQLVDNGDRAFGMPTLRSCD